MVSHLFYYQLALFALVWLSVMLHVTGSKPGLPTPPAPAKPKRKRSTEPKAFAGLTHKPPCALCEQETADTTPPPPIRPAPMPPTNRRPRTVDTSRHFCPHTACDYRGWLGLNNLRANGHPSGGPWRQFHCLGCNGFFRSITARFFMASRQKWSCCACWRAWPKDWAFGPPRGSLRSIPIRSCTGWWTPPRSSRPFRATFLCKVHVQQVQLDELYAVLSAVKDGQMREEEAIRRLSRSPQWVWTAIDPQSKLLLAITVGPRTQAMAQRVVHQVMEVLAPGCLPLFITDGFKEYMSALLSHFGYWVQPPRRQATGPAPAPRWMPLPELLYAQVIKTTRRRRLVRVSHRAVFGTFEAVQQVLAACGWQINTSFVERLNLTIRQHVAAIGRRVSTLCKGEEGLAQQLALYHGYYNFCLPHGSVRQPLSQPVPTNGTGSAKQWRPCTPAMAAGLTDHVWTLKEVPYRVPPWPQP